MDAPPQTPFMMKSTIAVLENQIDAHLRAAEVLQRAIATLRCANNQSAPPAPKEAPPPRQERASQSTTEEVVSPTPPVPSASEIDDYQIGVPSLVRAAVALLTDPFTRADVDAKLAQMWPEKQFDRRKVTSAMFAMVDRRELSREGYREGARFTKHNLRPVKPALVAGDKQKDWEKFRAELKPKPNGECSTRMSRDEQ